MSKQVKRKITVNINSKNKALPKSRPSVFERLGTKAATVHQEVCHHWAQNGTCPYGKSCKYSATHTLISPSKQRAAKKENETKKRHTKENVHKKLHGKVGQTTEDWGQWDPIELDEADPDDLEKRRLELQRELERQMKMENKARKKEKKIKKESSPSSDSSSSSSDSSSSSEDSSTSSSSSAEVRKKNKKTKSHRDSSSSSDCDKLRKKRVKGKKHSSKRTAPRYLGRPKKEIVPKVKASVKSPSPMRTTKKSQTPPIRLKTLGIPKVVPNSKSPRPSSSSDSHKDKHRTPSPKPIKEKEREREKEKVKEREKERERERDREKEREKERDKEKEKEKEREKERERERAKDKEKDKDRDKKREMRSPKRDSRTSVNQKKRDSPDSSHSKDRKPSPNRSRTRTGSVSRKDIRKSSPSSRDDRRSDKREDHDRNRARDRPNDRNRKDKRESPDRERERERKLTREEREAAREKEREEALARCQERQRERERLKELVKKDEERRNRDRTRRDDRGLEKPASDRMERLLPLPSERIPQCRRDLTPDESLTGRHRDRRERSSDRNRPSGSRRSLERHNRIERETDRMNRMDREREEMYNYNHVDRNYNRERDIERDRDYCAIPPRIREQERRHGEQSYHSPYDHGRHEDHRYMELDDRYNENSREERMSLEAREYAEDPRALNWDMRDERDLDQRHYGREDSRPPSLKGREWDVNEYGERDWDRGRRPMDWDSRAAWNMREHEHMPVDEEWRHYNRSMDSWTNDERKRWGNEWREPREHSRPRSSLSHRGVEEISDIPPRDITREPSREISRDTSRDNLREAREPIPKKEPTKEEHPPLVVEGEENIKSDILGKRPAADQPLEEMPESKRPCLKEPILEDDLSEISDDADEILNREEEIQDKLKEDVQQQTETTNNSEKDLSLNQQAQTSTSSQKSQSPTRLLTKDDSLEEENIDLDFEEISEDELEEEARIKGLGDALGVDWASLVAESKPRIKPVSSAKRRWEGHNILVNIGISVEMAGEETVKNILREHSHAKLIEEKKLLSELKEPEPEKEIKKEPLENIKEEPLDGAEWTEVKVKVEDVEVKEEVYENESENSKELQVEISHPVAAVQVCLREEKAIRKNLFTSAGPYRRALSARRDLAIRRHLSCLPIKDTFVETPKRHDPELLKLAKNLFERCL